MTTEELLDLMEAAEAGVFAFVYSFSGTMAVFFCVRGGW